MGDKYHKQAPLHARTHWRTIRSVMNEIGKYENIIVSNYNLNDITCYECFGDTFKGNYVTYLSDADKSGWVSDNRYDVFEAPYHQNPKNEYAFTGDFLYLAHNLDFDYWIFGKSKDEVVYTTSPSKYSEIFTYSLIGRYEITFGNKPTNNYIKKVSNKHTLSLGNKTGSFKNFDELCTRKCAFERKSKDEVIKDLQKSRSKIEAVGSEPVKIYKKRKSTKRRKKNSNSKGAK